MKRFSVSAVAMLALCTATGAATGCSDQGADAGKTQRPTEELGNIKLTLTGTGSSGDSYVLRTAILTVEGPSTTEFFDTEDDPTRTVLSSTVPAGDYSVFLQEGWRLDRIDQNSGAVTEGVPAELTSPNPQAFAVQANNTTGVFITFRVGDDVVGMGNYEIGVGVDDGTGGGDGGVPGGLCRTDSDCATGETCCLAGFLGTCYALEPGANCPLPDLTVSAETALSSLNIVHENFAADSCAIVEGCVDGTGDRRLMRFSTQTPNVGEADMILGEPNEDLGFEFSSCHNHYHFNGYAAYELLDNGGNVVRTGHKQAFCLLDSSRIDPNAPSTGRFSCSFQGIQAGWSDVYGSGLDCQWVDITGVDAGEYVLKITINSDHTLPESDYENNTATIPVTIAADVPVEPGNPLSPCASGESGVGRDCGWSIAANQPVACTPGEALNATCGCGGGECVGDTVLRVCDGDAACTSASAIAQNDDSCGTYCSAAAFTCPASGTFTLLTGAYSSGQAATCNPVVTPVTP